MIRCFCAGEDVSADALHRKARWTAELGDETEDSTKKVELYRFIAARRCSSILFARREMYFGTVFLAPKCSLLPSTAFSRSRILTTNVASREAVDLALKSIAADDKNYATHKNAAIAKGKLLDHVLPALSAVHDTPVYPRWLILELW